MHNTIAAMCIVALLLLLYTIIIIVIYVCTMISLNCCVIGVSDICIMVLLL